MRFSNELNECWKYQNKGGKVPSNKWIAAISQQATRRCILTVEDGANQSNREETGRTVQGILIVLCKFLFFTRTVQEKEF